MLPCRRQTHGLGADRDVIEIMIPRPQVLRFARQGIKVMTRSDWGKKYLKLLKPRITQADTSHSVTPQANVGIRFNRRMPPPDC